MSEQNGGAGEPPPDGAEAIRIGEAIKIEGLRKSFGPNDLRSPSTWIAIAPAPASPGWPVLTWPPRPAGAAGPFRSDRR